MFLFYPLLRRNLYVAVLGSLIAILVFINFQIAFATDLAQHTILERLWRLFVILGALSGASVCYSFIYSRIPRVFWVFLVAGLGLGLVAAYRLDFLTYVYLFVLVVALDVLRLVAMAVRGPRRVLLRIAGANSAWMAFIVIGIAGCVATIAY